MMNDVEISGIVDPYANAAEKGWKIVDGSTLQQDLVLEADVVIVGSGSGGGMSADVLSAAGLDVVILEEGQLKSSDQFNMVERSAYSDLYQDAGFQATGDGSIYILQGRSVGGGTTVNWCSSFRTPDQVLQFWKDNFDLKNCSSADLKPHFK